MRKKAKKIPSIPIIKIGMIGGMFTGKTCLVTQYVNNYCEYKYIESKSLTYISINIEHTEEFKISVKIQKS